MPRTALRMKTVNRCILVVDIKEFSRLPNAPLNTRRSATLRTLLRHALWSTKLVPWRQQSTGDGMLYLFNARNRSIVVDTVAQLSRELSRHNRRHGQDEQLRLRVAFNSDEVILPRFTWRIPPSPAVTRAFRMLDSEELHEHLDSGQDDLAFVMAQHIYKAVITSGICASYEEADFVTLEFGRDAKPETPKRARVLRHGAVPKHAESPRRPSRTILADWLRVPVAVVQGATVGLMEVLRHHVSPPWRRGLRWGLLALLLLLFIRPPTVDCPVPTQLVVLAAPSIVEQVEDLAEDFTSDFSDEQGGCRTVNIRVFSAPSYAEIARFAADGWPLDSEAVTQLGPEPDVWIAASTGATRAVESELPAGGFERLGSVATSPLVLAAEPELKQELGLEETVTTWDEVHTWQELSRAGRIQVVRANPAASAAALLATEALYGAGTTTPGSRQDLEATIRPASVDEPTELCDMGHPPAGGTQAPRVLATSEQQLLTRNTGRGGGSCGALAAGQRLQAVYPHDERGETPFLDYPYTLLSAAFEHPQGRREELARQFYEYLVAPDARQQLAGVGFRNRERELSGDFGTPEGVDPTQPDAPATPLDLDAAAQTVTRWQMARPAARLILSMDVSGSMGEPYTGGGTRIGAAREAAAELVRQLTVEDYIGLWAFAENLPPDNTTDYQPLTSLDRVDAQASGLSQRDRVLRALDRLTQENRGTRLYEMLMAGLEELRQTGGPDEVKGLLVVTDGLGEARPGAGPEEVLARLGEDVFLFLLVFGPAGCDLPGPATLDQHRNVLCIDANTVGLPAAFAQISTMLLGGP